MIASEWDDPKLVQEYSSKAANPKVNWFEYEVNLPAMLTLLPEGAQTILDFGCGAGDITAMLANKYPTVEGCDPSPAMLALAKDSFPSIPFFDWDGTTLLRDKHRYYDLIFAKLALHFIDDLGAVATQLFDVLRPGGSLVFSVPHPSSSAKKIGAVDYWQQTPYAEEIGSYNISVTMIHRSLQDYITPFMDAGFVLTALSEPQIPTSITTKYNVSEDKRKTPKRLNIRLTKPMQQNI